MNYVWRFLTGSSFGRRYFCTCSANPHTHRWGKKHSVMCTLWVYVHVLVCRCVGFRFFSTISYVISIVWYPCGLATLSQMTWWQSWKANKETSAANQSFRSATSAKNMTKSNNRVVWKQWTRKKVLGFNLNENRFTLIVRTATTLHEVQTAPFLLVSIAGGPWFLQLQYGAGAKNSSVTKKTKMTPR